MALTILFAFTILLVIGSTFQGEEYGLVERSMNTLVDLLFFPVNHLPFLRPWGMGLAFPVSYGYALLLVNTYRLVTRKLLTKKV